MKSIMRVLTTVLVAVSFAASAQAAVKLGRSAPALRGPDLAGNQVNIEDYRGKWVYLDLATWCGPCMKALPEVVELSKRTKDRDDLVIVGISLDDSRTAGKLASVVSKAGISYPIIFEGTGKDSSAAEGWGVNAIPATFLIDPDGNVAGVDVPPSYVEQVLIKAGASGGSQRRIQHSSVPRADTDGPRISARDVLLPDSPSSGDPTLRDLEIKTSISTSSPMDRYRVSVVFSAPQGKKGNLVRVWRYNFKLTGTPASSAAILTEISPAPGKIVGLDLAKLGGGKLPSKVDPSMPPISATYSASKALHTIVIPVPSGISDLYYSLAVFDAASQSYVDGGLVRVTI
jgi:peroxiredoxin